LGGPPYEQSLRAHLQVKYQDKPIGVVVAIGDATLEYVLRWRTSLWPGIPVVFSMVDETTVGRLKPPPDVTGSIMKLRLADAITSARAVVPDLKTIVFVGDAWESQTVYGHWKEEIPTAVAGLKVVDLTDTPMQELRKRVATLPDHSAILYTSIYSDGEGTFYPPADAITFFAETANRPIIVSAETFVGRGGIGGFVMTASAIGKEAAKSSLRILDGESLTNMPPTAGNVLQPVFDWRQLQRWRVAESRLPQDSKILFRDPTLSEQYLLQFLIVIGALLFQGALITWLIYERRNRNRAEVLARNSMSELTHLNRVATAGELSASIAHEVNQPLSSITTSASAGLRWLMAEPPNIEKAKAALTHIREAGHRAADVMTNIRAMFAKERNERSPVDINSLILSVLAILRHDVQKYGVEVEANLDNQLPAVEANPVQLQQVILNLTMNAIEAMHTTQPRVLIVRSQIGKPGMVQVSISDNGTGIDPVNLEQVFSALFTTKVRGMGMGLSICQSIIASHEGQIWATAGSVRGATFHFEVPIKAAGKAKAAEDMLESAA
jgi:signal transduction histidine kinase